jgi:ketosteroid isomerase-like protein
MTNGELARRGWEAARRGDLDVVAKMLYPEVKWHGGDPVASGACQNRDQAVAFIGRGRAGRPLPELVEVHDAGDKGVVILRRRATEDGHSQLVANLTSIRNGNVVEIVHYEDLV